MTEERTICAVCAWRENCQKKCAFQSSGQLRCPDYTRDVAFKKEEEDKKK
ncbi:MAG: hypothetical protein AB1896_09165 [Thermodesulfobacteriota bacterium]